MKKILLFILTFITVSFALAGPVDKKKAEVVAKNFLAARLNKKAASITFKAEYDYKYSEKTALYIFNAQKSFVIVSGDDNVEPILAYSYDREIKYPIKNKELKWWLDGYAQQILAASKAKSVDPKIKEQWEELLNGTYTMTQKALPTYLVQTTWDQTGGSSDYPYNYFCPSNTPVGCVATATSQIMRYWKYPKKGRGWHSYWHPQYGQVYAIFDTTNYNWDNMPLDSSTRDVALLCYQVGVSVDMSYSPSGSGAYTFDLTYALNNYFGYSKNIMYYTRAQIEKNGTTAWKDTLKAQIDSGQPMVYAGFDPNAGGHAFVCDGYDSATDKFHFNWGWAGYGDGWYTIDNLAPEGSSYNFSNGQSAVVNIKPDTTSTFGIVTGQGINDMHSVEFLDFYDTLVAYGVGGQDNQLMKSKTAGAIWNAIKFPSDFSGYQASMVDAVSEDTIFVPVFSTMGKVTRLLESCDGGKTWKSVLTGADPNQSFFNVVHFFDSKRGIVEGDPVNGEFEVYYTEDGGQNWTRVDANNIPSALKDEYGTVGYYYGTKSKVWFFTTKGRVFFSKDYGKTWTVTNLITPDSIGDNDGKPDLVAIKGAISDLAGGGILVETYYKYTPTDTTVLHYYYKSTDTGYTWTKFTPEGPVYDNGIDFVHISSGYKNLTGFFISVGNGISYSADLDHWIDLNIPYYGLFTYTAVSALDVAHIIFGSYRVSLSGNVWYMGKNSSIIERLKASQDRGCINTAVEFTDNSVGDVQQIEWDFGADANPQTATGPGPISVVYGSAGEKQIIHKVVNSDGTEIVDTINYKVDGQAPGDLGDIQGDEYPVLGSNYNYSVASQDVHYLWNLPDKWTIIGNKDTNVINVKVDGSLGDKVIKVQPQNGCGVGPTSVLSVSVIHNTNLLYPNPSTDIIYIENVKDADIMVIDSKGSVVERFHSNDYLAHLNVSDSRYTNGVYTVVIVGKDGKKRTSKIIVNKPTSMF